MHNTQHLSFECQFLAIYSSAFDRIKVNKSELIQHTSESKFKKLMILAKLSVKVSKYCTWAIKVKSVQEPFAKCFVVHILNTVKTL